MNMSDSSIKVNEPLTGTDIKTEQATGSGPHIQVMRLGRTDDCTYGQTTIVGGSTSTNGTLICSANPNRLEIIVCNDSSSIVYLSFSLNGSVSKGVRLNPNGGTFTSVNYTGDIYGWSTSQSAIVTYAEIGEPSA